MGVGWEAWIVPMFCNQGRFCLLGVCKLRLAIVIVLFEVPTPKGMKMEVAKMTKYSFKVAVSGATSFVLESMMKDRLACACTVYMYVHPYRQLQGEQKEIKCASCRHREI